MHSTEAVALPKRQESKCSGKVFQEGSDVGVGDEAARTDHRTQKILELAATDRSSQP